MVQDCMEKNETIRISKESKSLALKVIVVPPTMLKNDSLRAVSWKSIKIVKPFSYNIILKYNILDLHFLKISYKRFSQGSSGKLTLISTNEKCTEDDDAYFGFGQG